MPAGCATVAVSSTSALSVGQSTPLHRVPPLLRNAANSKNLEHELLSRYHSKPVTTVKVDRVNFLLTGYHPPLNNYLVNGCLFGFRIGFVGSGELLNRPTFKALFNNQRLYEQN